MAEQIIFPASGSKESRYQALIPQIESLLESETDMIANMANLCAVLKQAFGFFWAGFYLVKGEELVLGPFQGLLACTRIAFGRGVCGTAWKKRQTVIVPDVDKFPGHIACSGESKSEIVIPWFDKNTNQIIGVLDIDSERLNAFDEIDALYLEKICGKL
jgi:GAF domain-containing protein